MERLRRPRDTRLGRLLRGRRPDRNPVRRASDRAETAVLGVLLAAFLAGAPFAAHAAGSWSYAASSREAQAQQATYRQVSATLLQAAPDGSPHAFDVGAAPGANARWWAPDGQLRTGPVFVPRGTAAGSTVLVWTNHSGQLAGPPLQPIQVAGRAQLAAALAVAAAASMLIVIGVLVRWAFYWRRLAAWDAAWLANGPRWSSRH
jgi:hypothetical protein